ncbi:hypothetical protein V8G54_024407, partial [Vigna mungo]
ADLTSAGEDTSRRTRVSPSRTQRETRRGELWWPMITLVTCSVASDAWAGRRYAIVFGSVTLPKMHETCSIQCLRDGHLCISNLIARWYMIVSAIAIRILTRTASPNRIHF